MELSYVITYKDGSLRPIHNLVIGDEQIISTRQKEVLAFARPRITAKYDWKQLKEAIRLGNHLQIMGGN